MIDVHGQDREDISSAIDIAIEDLAYRVDELGDSGDYEAEDIAGMQDQLYRLRSLRDRLAGD